MIMTPIMPLMTGDPPTKETTRESWPNHGYRINARVIEIALNMPKYSPKFMSKSI